MNFSTLLFITSVFALYANKDNVAQQCTSICKSLGANSPTDLKDCSSECFDVVGKMTSIVTPQPDMTSSQVTSIIPSKVSSMDVIVVSKSETSRNTMSSIASSASMSISSTVSASASDLASASASMMKSSQVSLSSKSGPTETAKPLGSASKPSSSKSKGSTSDSSNANFATPSITFLAMTAFVSYLQS